ncbi:MAG TPA: hypothetical protein PKA55_07525 [Rhodoblastus sp.]|nr:hypothetical protein [Rhodoblastus sp.]
MSKLSRWRALGALGALLATTLAYAQTPTPDPRNRPAPGPATPSAASPAAMPTAAASSAAGDNNLGMAILAAQVSAAATINFGAGATGASKVAGRTGTYEVDFNRDVSQCFYSVSVFNGEVVATGVEPRSGNANGVFLLTETLSGGATDAPFYLTVFCAK